MGPHHAMTGAAAWIAVTTTAGHGLGLYPVTPMGTLTGALLCAGAALLADADHASATISRSIPVLGRLVTSGLSRASGGHRHGLHSILAVVCAWLLATGLSRLTWQPAWWPEPIGIGVALMSAATMTFAVKALGLARQSWALAWLIGVAVAVIITLYAPGQWDWFVVCFTLGYAIHLVGDLLTDRGLPLLWPFRPRPPRAWRRVALLDALWSSGGNVALPVLGNAGSRREWMVLIPVTAYVCYGALYAVLDEAGANLAWFG